jgi:hypothetical protein
MDKKIKKIQENKEGMKLNRTHQLLVYYNDVNLLVKHKQITLVLHAFVICITAYLQFYFSIMRTNNILSAATAEAAAHAQ